MGCFDTFCSFCAGPLCDARYDWLELIGGSEDPWPPTDGWMGNPPGFPMPTKPREEIVTITESDGLLWEDWVALGPIWAHTEYVSPPWYATSARLLVRKLKRAHSTDSAYGIPLIEGDDAWSDEAGPFLCIHRICLSIFCRRLNVAPKVLWDTFHAHGSPYSSLPDEYLPSGLLKCVRYYDIEGRQGQSFDYVLERHEKAEDGSRITWYDHTSMEDCQWLLARPTVFPRVERIDANTNSMAPSPSSSVLPLLRVLAISELFNLCISFLRSPRIQDPDHQEPIPHPHVLSTLLALLKTNRALHSLLLNRQDMFYQLVLDSKWMLPFCPADWAEWKAIQNPSPLPSPSECSEWDWRGYLLVCARLGDPHMKNRWRFHRMLMQFSLPTTVVAPDSTEWTWNVSGLEGKLELLEPKPWAWESPVED